MFEPLTSQQINNYYRNNPLYGGCISKDQLKYIEKNMNLKHTRRFWIINLQNYNDGGGTHWVALSLLNPEHGVYFDSFSTDPPENILKFMKRYRKTNYMNNEQIQDLKSTSCGYYAIYVLDNLLKGRLYNDVINDFRLDNFQHNEMVLEKYFMKK